MFKKKAMAIAGAVVVTVSLLAGVTYAWFTNTQTATAASITAGKLGIEFSVTDNDVEELLIYPQLTGGDGKPVIVAGSKYPDVAEYTFKLVNVSDRQVLVRVSGQGVTVSPGDVTAAEALIATEGEALRFYYDFDYEDFIKVGDNIYIYLPVNEELEVTAQVWIDGETGGNEYQGAKIDFSEMTATAVQYREDAIRSTFAELTDTNVAAIEVFADFE